MGSSIAALGVSADYRKMFVEAPWLACRLYPLSIDNPATLRTKVELHATGGKRDSSQV